MNAPEGFEIPTLEMLKEWHYINVERLGLLCEDQIPTDQQRAIAAFGADRHIEGLYPVECNSGWVRYL